ncbi:MAG: hypothetical protein AB1Z29_12395 [Desulfobacterales bacterium]
MQKIISRCYDYYYLVKGIDANFRTDGAPVIPGLTRNPENIPDAGSLIPYLIRERHDTRNEHLFLALRHSFKSKKTERNNSYSGKAAEKLETQMEIGID